MLSSCIVPRSGAGIHACGKAAEEIASAAEVMDSAQARKNGNSAQNSNEKLRIAL
jgi:hypothetical protein